jgi:hypothetical protein
MDSRKQEVRLILAFMVACAGHSSSCCFAGVSRRTRTRPQGSDLSYFIP